MRRIVVAGLFVLAITSPVVAQGRIIPRPCGFVILPAEPREPGRTPPITRPVSDCRQNIVRTRSDVRVELANRVLRYEVEERFVNRGGTIGEADYIFPLPRDAAFQDLKLSIDGQLVSGETMASSEARRIYENIVRTQRDPALVEWMGHGLLRARIFPLNPGEEKRIVVRFQSVAPREGDALRVDYFRGGAPGTTNVRDDESGSSSFTFSYRPSTELGNPYSPTHQLDASDRDGKREIAVRGDARDVTLLVPVRTSAGTSISMLPYAPGNEDGFALITVTPPAARRDDPMPRDVTLVLDVSGSMSGRKMEQARAAGRQLLNTLRPADRFRLIDFSSDVHTFRDDFVSASPENLREAARYLDALEAVGATNIEGALREALRPVPARGRLPLVLFVTDGEPTVGERSPDRLAAMASVDRPYAGAPGARIFTFGLGSDVNVGLLEQLAMDGRGTSQFVRPDESVERMVAIVASRLVDPVLTDVRVHVEGDATLARALPSQPADIFADRDLVLLARYTGHGSARVIVEGNRRGTPVRWESQVTFPERERDNPFVARLWATQRVGYLSAQKHKNGASAEIDDEIRSLGERYGIPTEFTSYLVVEPRLAMNRALNSQGVQAVPVAMAAGSPAPQAARDMRFESAKAASLQRVAVNTAMLDSMAASGERAGSARRSMAGRTFELRDSTWTDVRFRAGMEKTTIKPFTQAYFALIAELPELRGPFALGARVIVVGKTRAIALAENGVSDLAPAALAAIVKAW